MMKGAGDSAISGMYLGVLRGNARGLNWAKASVEEGNAGRMNDSDMVSIGGREMWW